MDRKISAGTCLVQLVDNVDPDGGVLWAGVVGSIVQAGQLRGYVAAAGGGDFVLEVLEFDRDVFFVDVLGGTEELKKAMAL